KFSSVSDFYYDKGILCADCDNSFSEYEEYFSSFINGYFQRIKLTAKDVQSETNYKLIGYNNFDYKKFKLALLFTIWKSSISDHYAFQNFKLDETHERKIKQALRSKDPYPPSLFPFVVYSLKKVDSELAN